MYTPSHVLAPRKILAICPGNPNQGTIKWKKNRAVQDFWAFSGPSTMVDSARLQAVNFSYQGCLVQNLYTMSWVVVRYPLQLIFDVELILLFLHINRLPTYLPT